MDESYYKYHVFFCINKRDGGKQCCENEGATSIRDYAKKKSQALGLARKGGVRINNAGCLNRCAQGPVLVVYPEAVWYTYVDHEDIDEIFEKHLVQGSRVERLLLP